jgi:flagellar motility protein MotE (MotC chaperone)
VQLYGSIAGLQGLKVGASVHNTIVCILRAKTTIHATHLDAMAVRSTAEEMERLQLEDEDTEDLWNSPSKRGAHKSFKPRPSNDMPSPEPRQSHDGADTLFDRQEAREAALKHELHAVRNINEVIEGLLNSIDKAKGNMEVRSGHFEYLRIGAQNH